MLFSEFQNSKIASHSKVQEIDYLKVATWKVVANTSPWSHVIVIDLKLVSDLTNLNLNHLVKNPTIMY